MEQTVRRPRPWLLPFWLMLGIILVSFIENVFVFTAFLRTPLFSRPVLLGAMLWPSVLLVEVILYWFMRKRITDRKWVWAHVGFSLFAFVFLWPLYVVILYVIFSNTEPVSYVHYLGMIQKIQQYAFWLSVVIGHVFFVIAIVRSFNNKNSFDPDRDTDFLSELPG